mgnify:CR=1 FL=1
MKKLDSYSFTIYPNLRYAEFLCDDKIFNTNFDELLMDIGKYYYKKTDIGVNGICALIRDEINKEWHLNKLRKRIQLKKVSATQIKTIRRSFLKINDSNQNYIRIPFDVVSILFYIIKILYSIENENFDKSKYINAMNKTTISQYLYKEHTQIFNEQYLNKINCLSDRALIEKYNRLYSMLTGFDSFLSHSFKDIDWNKSNQYVIK